MLCYFLNRGIEPKHILNLPFAEKLFYKACHEIYVEDEIEKYKALTGGGGTLEIFDIENLFSLFF